MEKTATPPKNIAKLGWKHVLLMVLLAWLTLSFVGGEKLRFGSVEMTLPGFSFTAKDVQRDVSGLPLSHRKPVKPNQ